MPWLAAAVAGSAALNYFGGQKASQAAADTAALDTAAQERMNTANIQSQRDMQLQNLSQINKWNALNDPFAASGARSQFVQPLTDLAKGDMSSITTDPLYRSMTLQGQDAISRRMAASDMSGSGGELVALGNYTQGNMLDAYKTKLATLMSLSGANTPGTPYQGTAPQGQILQPQITPGLSYNMTAAPYAGAASTLGTIASLYGTPNVPSSSTTTQSYVAGNVPSWYNSSGNYPGLGSTY